MFVNTVIFSHYYFQGARYLSNNAELSSVLSKLKNKNKKDSDYIC